MIIHSAQRSFLKKKTAGKLTSAPTFSSSSHRLSRAVLGNVVAGLSFLVRHFVTVDETASFGLFLLHRARASRARRLLHVHTTSVQAKIKCNEYFGVRYLRPATTTVP